MTGDTLWAWQVQEPDDQWSLILTLIPGVGSAVLVHRRLDIIGKMRPLAEGHSKATGQPLRLARFALAEVLE
jgi:hypothetical protein